MPIHFAAATPFASAFIARGNRVMLRVRAANDNGARIGHDPLLRDALKHFAAHGLGAAEEARLQAERAFFRGDRQAYRHWLAICRTLDRRLATSLAKRVETPRA